MSVLSRYRDFSRCCDKMSNKKTFKGERIHFGSQFKGTDHHHGESMVAGV